MVWGLSYLNFNYMEIKTKFDIGNTIWLMIDNKPRIHTIREIQIYTNSETKRLDEYDYRTEKIVIKNPQINYVLDNGIDINETGLNKSFFKTKEELINSL